MKKLLKIFMFLLSCYPVFLLAQNEFGTIGSYWNYDYQFHSGNGYGWDKILITGDTVVNGIEGKILMHTSYTITTFPPIYENEREGYFGFLYTQNDSVFIDGNLIFDFGIEAGDTLLSYEGSYREVMLVVDSIVTVNLYGVDHKKYYGNKFCTLSKPFEPFEEFEVIESIGAISDFFIWGLDGCMIGGGSHHLRCYKNGDFSFPEFADCEELVLSNNKDLPEANNFKIYPNPAQDIVMIDGISNDITAIEVYNVNGAIVLQKDINNNKSELDLSLLNQGIYFLSVLTKKERVVRKLVKE